MERIAFYFLLIFCGTSCAPIKDDGKNISNSTIRPIIMMHGLVSGPETLFVLRDSILKNFPGTPILMLKDFSYEYSVEPLEKQVTGIAESIKNFTEEADGITFICYSQGSLICRGILEQTKQHKVHTFISIAGPLAGQFGMTDFLNFWFPGTVRRDVHKYIYSWIGQRYSVGNFWRDPFQYEDYIKYNPFLPKLDNEFKHDQNEDFKSNFLEIQKMVLIGGPNDGVIEPYQSSFFGFYDLGTDNETLPYYETEAYVQDRYGLKTLDERGGIILHNISDVSHLEWHHNEEVFQIGILPYLT